MSYTPPTPPADLPKGIVDTLNGYSSDKLQDVARYAEELAEHKAREARLEEESDEKKRPRIVPTISRMMFQRKQQSRSKKSTTIATTTGNGEKEIRLSPNTKGQSTPTSSYILLTQF